MAGEDGVGCTALEKEETVGQEPNIHLGVEDLPRGTDKPGAPRRWEPRRPGDMAGPESVPWGGTFGTPAPDVGYAIKIVRGLDLPTGDVHAEDVEAAVVAVMTARASLIGRAPTAADAVLAIDLLDLEGSGAAAVAGIAHDRARLGSLVASFPEDRLSR